MIDIETLLAPISEEYPAGHDFRSHALYYTIREARLSAGYHEKQLEGDASADWNTVFDMAQDILMHHSKDLEVTAWFIEALLRKEGLAGLSTGFLLAEQLMVHYWNNGFPTMDEDGISRKIFSFTALNGLDDPGTLISALSMTPLITGKTNFALWQYKDGLKNKSLFDEIKIAAAGMSLNEQKKIKKDARDCLEHFQNLTKIFDECCGKDSPPSSNIKNLLEEIFQTLVFLFPEPELVSAPLLPTPTENLSEPLLSSRQSAFESLRQVAHYFSVREPHSPLPFIIQRAIAWGQLSWPDLLEALIHDEQTRLSVFELTGVNNTTKEIA